MRGQGIQPRIQLDPDSETFDAGDVLVNDSVTVPLKVIIKLMLLYRISQGAVHSYDNTKFLLGVYFFKVKNENSWTICEVCSKLTIKR